MLAYTEAGKPVKNFVSLLVSDRRRRGVGYVSVYSPKRKQLEPLGTVFFADLKWGGRKHLTYAITARHCVDSVGDPIYIETSKPDGSYLKIETRPEDWALSDNTDVACMVVTGDDSMFHSITLPESFKVVGVSNERPHPDYTYCGEEVFIVGLFSKSAYRDFGGEPSVEPIVRFGRVSLRRTEAPVYLNSKHVGDFNKAVTVSAMLIESISFGGESGAPVFEIGDDHKANINENDLKQFMEDFLSGRHTFSISKQLQITTDQDVDTPLIGMVSSHWQMESEIRSASRHKLAGNVGLNSGIAVVIPASDIIDFIMNDQKVKDRREKVPRGTLSEPTTPLSARAESDPVFTKQDFESALKKVSKKIQPSQSDEGKSKT